MGETCNLGESQGLHKPPSHGAVAAGKALASMGRPQSPRPRCSFFLGSLNVPLKGWHPISVSQGNFCRFGLLPLGETHTLGESQGPHKPHGASSVASRKVLASGVGPQPPLWPHHFFSLVASMSP